ncbi:hypothetical protein KSP39_PZI024164 [Platanthera zijinensis]|uniref:Uncharacterized protein n=1 Tax=Platanthera zijinensis TaxID=2320716 RepID=A0AAP0FRU9_9ASPA
MGCSSSSSLRAAAGDGYPSTAMIVATDGSLIEYSGGITVAEALVAAGQGCVLCHSDKIFFDAYPPAAAPEEKLEPGQIYFLLSSAQLRRRLNGSNAATLAMRASSALKRAAEKRGRKMRIRVAPMAGAVDLEVGRRGRNLEWRPARRCLGRC